MLNSGLDQYNVQVQSSLEESKELTHNSTFENNLLEESKEEEPFIGPGANGDAEFNTVKFIMFQNQNIQKTKTSKMDKAANKSSKITKLVNRIP